MAAVNLTISSINQKLARNTQVAAQEDTWTITGTGGTVPFVLYVRPSVDTFYHSTLGQTATDGLAIKAGTAFPVLLASQTTVFYLRPISTAGTVEAYTSILNMGIAGQALINTDGSSSLTQGNSIKPTYTISDLAGAPTGANTVLATFNAGAAKTTRLRRLIVSNPGSGTALAGLQLELVRTTAAFAAGAAQTPSPHEAADGAFSGLAAITNPTITAGTRVWSAVIFQPATTVGNFSPAIFEFYGQMAKAITVPAGVTNGLALRVINGNAGAAGFAFSMEFTEESV